jgi:hypothetical protein
MPMSTTLDTDCDWANFIFALIALAGLALAFSGFGGGCG